LELSVTDTIFLNDTLTFDRSITLLYEGGGSLPIHSASSGVGFLVESTVTLHLHNVTLGGIGTTVIENAGVVHFHNVVIDASEGSTIGIDNRQNAHVHGVVEILK
jgi:hypothetical protein